VSSVMIRFRHDDQAVLVRVVMGFAYVQATDGHHKQQKRDADDSLP
jgi:hypothetical protein